MHLVVHYAYLGYSSHDQLNASPLLVIAACMRNHCTAMCQLLPEIEEQL